MRELYHARLLDHAQNPRNKEACPDATRVVRAANPSCGDTLTLFLVLAGGHIVRASFTGEGCAVSQAAASLLTEAIRGMEVCTAVAFTEHDLYELLGVEVGEARKQCALLAWGALKDALRNERGV